MWISNGDEQLASMHVSVRRTLTIYGCSLAVDPWVMTSHLWIPGWSFHSLLDTYTHKTHTESLTPHSQTLSHIANKHEECVDTHLGTVSILFSSTHSPNVPLLLSNTFKFLKNKSLQCSFLHIFCSGTKERNSPHSMSLFLHSLVQYSAINCCMQTHTQWQDLPPQAPKVWWKCWECVLRGHWHFLHFLVMMTCLRHLMPRWLLPPDI